MLISDRNKSALCAGATATVTALGLSLFLAFAGTSPARAEDAQLRSGAFIVKALEGKGLKVLDTRRDGQLYIVKVEQDGTTALLAIDGYSSEIVGLKVIALAAGAAAKPARSAGNHFVDITYEYGYEVEETSFESYSEVTSEELSTTEDYSAASVEPSEEVRYDAVDDQSSGDLDEGTAGDEAGDQAAEAAEEEAPAE